MATGDSTLYLLPRSQELEEGADFLAQYRSARAAVLSLEITDLHQFGGSSAGAARRCEELFIAQSLLRVSSIL